MSQINNLRTDNPDELLAKLQKNKFAPAPKSTSGWVLPGQGRVDVWKKKRGAATVQIAFEEASAKRNAYEPGTAEELIATLGNAPEALRNALAPMVADRSITIKAAAAVAPQPTAAPRQAPVAERAPAVGQVATPRQAASSAPAVKPKAKGDYYVGFFDGGCKGSVGLGARRITNSVGWAFLLVRANGDIRPRLSPLEGKVMYPGLPTGVLDYDSCALVDSGFGWAVGENNSAEALAMVHLLDAFRKTASAGSTLCLCGDNTSALGWANRLAQGECPKVWTKPEVAEKYVTCVSLAPGLITDLRDRGFALCPIHVPADSGVFGNTIVDALSAAAGAVQEGHTSKVMDVKAVTGVVVETTGGNGAHESIASLLPAR